jgi:hypothetical protein
MDGLRRCGWRLRGVVAALLTIVAALLTIVAAAPAAMAAGDANMKSCPSSPEGLGEASPGFRTYLPDCRAYELMSPPYKRGFWPWIKFLSQDGSRAIVESTGTFAGDQEGSIENRYGLSRVEGSGWEAQALSPSATEFDWVTLPAATPDLTHTLWAAQSLATVKKGWYVRQPGGHFDSIGPLFYSPEPVTSESTEYAGASRELTHVLFTIRSRESAGEATMFWPGDTTYNGLNAIKSLYEYTGTGNTEPVLVGVENNEALHGSPHVNEGAVLISQCGTELGGPEEKYNAVSENGETVFFTAKRGLQYASPFEHSTCGSGTPGTAPLANALYARIGGSHKVWVSEPRCTRTTPACVNIKTTKPESKLEGEAAAVQYQGASFDGSKVFFTTTQQLVNGDEDIGNDLYMAQLGCSGGKSACEPAQREVTGLVQVSHNFATPAEAAKVQGVARVTPDGSRVYFVAKGKLATNSNGQPANPEAQAGADNMYVYDTESKETRFVAMLCSGYEESGGVPSSDSKCKSYEPDEEVWKQNDGRPVEVSANGSFLVFSSHAQLTADDSGTVAQVFEYDAQTHSLARVSIGQSGSYYCSTTGKEEAGFNCDGNTENEVDTPSILKPFYTQSDNPAEFASTLTVADDGTVVFSTPSRLTPQALNNAVSGCSYKYEGVCYRTVYANNVYEYRDGNVYLISDGRDVTMSSGASSVVLGGIDASGRDVYFLTGDSLVPQDTDTQVDLYDARIGGGFAAPASPAACTGEACRGSSSGPPLLPSLGGSGGPAGGDNLAPAPAVKPKAKPLTNAQKLSKALKACEKRPKKKREACKKQARKRYDGKSKAKKSAKGGK